MKQPTWYIAPSTEFTQVISQEYFVTFSYHKHFMSYIIIFLNKSVSCQ